MNRFVPSHGLFGTCCSHSGPDHRTPLLRDHRQQKSPPPPINCLAWWLTSQIKSAVCIHWTNQKHQRPMRISIHLIIWPSEASSDFHTPTNPLILLPPWPLKLSAALWTNVVAAGSGRRQRISLPSEMRLGTRRCSCQATKKGYNGSWRKLGVHRVTYAHYEELSCIFSVSDTVMSKNAVAMVACAAQKNNEGANTIMTEDMQPPYTNTATHAILPSHANLLAILPRCTDSLTICPSHTNFEMDPSSDTEGLEFPVLLIIFNMSSSPPLTGSWCHRRPTTQHDKSHFQGW